MIGRGGDDLGAARGVLSGMIYSAEFWLVVAACFLVMVR